MASTLFPVVGLPVIALTPTLTLPPMSPPPAQITLQPLGLSLTNFTVGV